MTGEPSSFEREWAAHRRRVLASACFGWLLFLICFSLAVWAAHINLARLGEGASKLGDFFHLMLPDLDATHLFDSRRTEGSFAYWYYGFAKWLAMIWQSIEIAILATVLGGAGAFLWSFCAARNLGLPRAVVWITRRLLEVCRIVPELVFALVFVFAFGIGPLAGVLAIAIHTTGALGKLFSEVIENISDGPLEGVRASGGSWGEVVRFGALPQVLPNMLSYTLLRFEINVAASTAIGVVGAGGIGMELRAALDLQLYPDVLAMILMIIACIFVIDLTSERLRSLFMREAARA